jgi:TPR repeat protein
MHNAHPLSSTANHVSCQHAGPAAEGGIPADYAKALLFARKAYEHGIKGSAAALLCDLEPVGAVALQRLREAAEEGDGYSCYRLAHAYWKGLFGLQRWVCAGNVVGWLAAVT